MRRSPTNPVRSLGAVDEQSLQGLIDRLGSEVMKLGELAPDAADQRRRVYVALAVLNRRVQGIQERMDALRAELDAATAPSPVSRWFRRLLPRRAAA